MFLTITGSGTSHGIPVIACDCKTCTSTDPKDTRLRCSAIAEDSDGTTIVIDPGPEFRIQALRYGLKRLDAVLITHSHADHIHGLDDIRIFSAKKTIPVYGAPHILADIRNRFDYVFKATQEGGGKPHIDLIDCSEFSLNNPLKIEKMNIIPIPLMHGRVFVFGYRIGNAAYLTDLNAIPETSFDLLNNLNHLVIDALRVRPHSTHLNFEQALKHTQKIKPQHAWFTHLCHDFTHNQVTDLLIDLCRLHNMEQNVKPAYDGLRLQIAP